MIAIVIAKIIKVLRRYEGVTLHELCMLINLGKIDYSFCRLAKLEDKPCKINYLALKGIVDRLERRGLIKSKKKRLQDPKSHYGFDYFRIIFIDRERRKSILDLIEDVPRLDNFDLE